MEKTKLYGRSIYLAATKSEDLQDLIHRLTEEDNARLFRCTYNTEHESVDQILAAPERGGNTYTIHSRTTGRAVGWVFFELSAERLDAVEFVSRRNRPELSLELLSLLGTIAFEQLGREQLDVKVGASDTVAGETAQTLGGTLIGVLARQMLQSGGSEKDFALYTTTKAMWPTVKSAIEAWLRAQYGESSIET